MSETLQDAMDRITFGDRWLERTKLPTRLSELTENAASIQSAMRSISRSDEDLRLTVGSVQRGLENLMMGPLDHRAASQLAFIGHHHSEATRQFRLPIKDELAGLAEAVASANTFANNSARISSSLEHAFASIRSPWLDVENVIGSASAVAKLQSVGQLANSANTFAFSVSDNLRPMLGDWRQIELPSSSHFLDREYREEFYISRGFDRSITDFPVEAFEESAEYAGLLRVLESDSNEEDIAIAVYRLIRRFEIEFRAFIEQIMSANFGTDWTETVLPCDVREQWNDKKRRKKLAGRPTEALINCADFTDYKRIIENKKIWPAFKGHFKRKESIQETLLRLEPVRIATMHANVVTLDDILLAIVEVRRIRKAIQ